jgi:DNA-binding transcriptional LysR family regulator
MTTFEISSFLVAAQTLNFTKAAEQTHVTQPVLSRRIAAMERELGIPLFVRHKKSLSLTPAGAILAEGLSNIANDYRQLIEKATEVQKGHTGFLRVGIIDGQTLNDPRIDMLRAFRKRHPDIKVSLSKNGIAASIQALENDQVDVVFGFRYDFEGRESITYIDVGVSKNYIVISRTHPLANEKNLSLADFANERFLIPDVTETSACLDRLSKRFEEAGLKVPDFRLAPDVGTLALWLEDGYGISVEDERHVLHNNNAFVFVKVPELKDFPEVAVWKKTSSNPDVPVFIRELKEWFSSRDRFDEESEHRRGQ